LNILQPIDKYRRGRPRKVWMDDIKEEAGRRGKTYRKLGPWQ
jgi:hypothetical protein